MVPGLVLAGDRWNAFGEFTARHPLLMTAVVMGIGSAIVITIVVGPVGIVLGPIVLGAVALMGWAVQKVRAFLGL